MPVFSVSGDPLLTDCQVLAFGYNARGQSESRDEQILLHQTFPAAFATFKRQARKGNIIAGQVWQWNDNTPNLHFWVIRESPYGATRIRYVQSIIMGFVRDYELYNIHSLALVRPGNDIEYEEFLPLINQWLDPLPIPIMLYENFIPDEKAEKKL